MQPLLGRHRFLAREHVHLLSQTGHHRVNGVGPVVHGIAVVGVLSQHGSERFGRRGKVAVVEGVDSEVVNVAGGHSLEIGRGRRHRGSQEDGLHGLGFLVLAAAPIGPGQSRLGFEVVGDPFQILLPGSGRHGPFSHVALHDGQIERGLVPVVGERLVPAGHIGRSLEIVGGTVGLRCVGEENAQIV